MESPNSKKEYVSPTLIEYGSISEITLSGGTGPGDIVISTALA